MSEENPYIITKFPGEYYFDYTKRFTVPRMNKGSQPTDGGNLIIEADEYENFIAKEPLAKKYIRRFIGAEEFLHNKLRYCLWLKDCPPDELRKMKLVYERVKKVRESRLQSPKAATRKAADKPTLFTEIRQPDSDYLCVPLVTSSARKYIPIGWVSKDVIASNLCSVIPNATLWLFGQLESIVHMAWMRAVGGRLGNGYRYSAEIVYNNFVFINADKKRLARIEKAAQKILDARAKFPNASLADLYDEVSMPYELRQAHAENDAAVMDAYGYPPNFSELQIVTDLLYRYQAMLTKIPESMVAATSRRNFDA